MNRLGSALRDVQRHLQAQQKPWALLGGLAVSARSEPRFTRDIDIAVAVDDDSAAEATCASLRQSGYSILASVEQQATGRLATVRLGSAGDDDGIVVDLLFASSGIEPEIVASSESLEVQPGLIVPVARAHHLLALKLLSRDDVQRPQDIADIKALVEVMSPADFDKCREAITQIETRGFNRGRDLNAALADAVAKYHATE